MAQAQNAPDPKEVLISKYKALSENMFNPDAFRNAVHQITEIDEPGRLEIIAQFDRALLEQDPMQKIEQLGEALSRTRNKLSYFLGKLVPGDVTAEENLYSLTSRGSRYLDGKFNVRRR